MGDERVLKYIAKKGMTEQEFYALPLPEQRRRIGLGEGQNPGPASYMRMPTAVAIPPRGFTELELDSLLMRRPNGGLE